MSGSVTARRTVATECAGARTAARVIQNLNSAAIALVEEGKVEAEGKVGVVEAEVAVAVAGETVEVAGGAVEVEKTTTATRMEVVAVVTTIATVREMMITTPTEGTTTITAVVLLMGTRGTTKTTKATDTRTTTMAITGEAMMLPTPKLSMVTAVGFGEYFHQEHHSWYSLPCSLRALWGRSLLLLLSLVGSW